MAPIDRYRRPADVPKRIPVFPLRGAILLPRASLPLNVFEPRYLAMVDDAIAGERVVGIVQLQRSDSTEESPEGKTAPLRRIGCAGRIAAYQELDDGRLFITLRGIARFEMSTEIATAKPYRVCHVGYEKFPQDFMAGAGEDRVDREKLLRVLKTYLDSRRLSADWQAIAKTSTEYLVNSLSLISPYGPEEKQALLEAADLKTRAEVLVTLAEMELASSGRGPSGTTLQ
ncbi:MAG: LON peptidase substrate-binding domain-containing protein [Hyphomicrobiaceae bacterium]